MNNIMEYEQVMEVFAEADRALMNNTQPSTQQEVLLLQDCMWNGLTQIKTKQLLTAPSNSNTDAGVHVTTVPHAIL